MTRRKGEVTRQQIDRDFPHQVEIAVPESGLRGRLMEMHEFCATRGLRARTRSVRGEVGQDAIRWCFADPEHADEFRDRFGGEKIFTAPR